jgi:hypothetical protein
MSKPARLTKTVTAVCGFDRKVKIIEKLNPAPSSIVHFPDAPSNRSYLHGEMTLKAGSHTESFLVGVETEVEAQPPRRGRFLRSGIRF